MSRHLKHVLPWVTTGEEQANQLLLGRTFSRASALHVSRFCLPPGFKDGGQTNHRQVEGVTSEVGENTACHVGKNAIFFKLSAAVVVTNETRKLLTWIPTLMLSFNSFSHVAISTKYKRWHHSGSDV